MMVSSGVMVVDMHARSVSRGGAWHTAPKEAASGGFGKNYGTGSCGYVIGAVPVVR